MFGVANRQPTPSGLPIGNPCRGCLSATPIGVADWQSRWGCLSSSPIRGCRSATPIGVANRQPPSGLLIGNPYRDWISASPSGFAYRQPPSEYPFDHLLICIPYQRYLLTPDIHMVDVFDVLSNQTIIILGFLLDGSFLQKRNP